MIDEGTKEREREETNRGEGFRHIKVREACLGSCEGGFTPAVGGDATKGGARRPGPATCATARRGTGITVSCGSIVQRQPPLEITEAVPATAAPYPKHVGAT